MGGTHCDLLEPWSNHVDSIYLKHPRVYIHLLSRFVVIKATHVPCILVFGWVLVSLALLTQTAVEAERRVALLIGNASYQHEKKAQPHLLADSSVSIEPKLAPLALPGLV
jgi:hypothetical protein